MLEVVICTHNPNVEYLTRTVESLKSQSLRQSKWGLVIVDNDSKRPVDSCHVDWHEQGRVLVEKKLGLSNARICGIRNTTTELILFVDDDNVLDSNYLEEVLRIAEDYPHLGAFGANKITPEFEEDPLPECRRYVRSLALRDSEGCLWSNDPRDGLDPWGAGLVVRREIANRFIHVIECDPVRQEFGRKGNSLNSAEDREFSWIACELGFGKGLFSTLKMRHLMSKGRTNKDYLVRIAEGHAFSHALMRYVHRDRYAQLADRFNLGATVQTVPRKPNAASRMKFAAIWLLSKISGKHKQMKNRIRMSNYRGTERARRLIESMGGSSGERP